METAIRQTAPDEAQRELESILEMVRPCMQCGTCTASCPNAFAMANTPRRLWRLLLSGFTEEALAGGSFWMCSSCYTCTLRCPRGLPLTEAMAALRRLAARYHPASAGRNATFYETFMDNVRTYGRVQETALMTSYFLAMKSMVLPLEFTSLGLRMLGKGKLHGPSSVQKGRLGPIFEKAAHEGGRP
ncbi:4Fe-4S dicluster domain-containing protein [Desulfolutivibrio sulfoxidireducens]|uniref:4Fe-4S dicluster domain-containing protein n=1 Tax=Desulfolutivibrio sulfoxidireducens TaxID=2773299 RepID=UPI00159E974A|nr:4Fe-4S dicluster domain-containing protein [Desulfolutivibrio sulfoxidireducens]QLA16890.1 4Fe-4S dicluster domain-containing protein [Desulfolutivibrio sulfoxidireducens]QLA20456.1 4Fe-4S dicluster domain-containing protein [Desulfolutivibrio sulfoxidireducens]